MGSFDITDQEARDALKQQRDAEETRRQEVQAVARRVFQEELDQVLEDLASVSIPGNSRQGAIRYAQQKLQERMGVQR